MTDQQNEIYKGLNSIGREIAEFYNDGIQIMASDLGSKSYLIGHILREIDGGLRDIFGLKPIKEKFQKGIKTDELELLFKEFVSDYRAYNYLKGVTLEEFKGAKGHIASIVVSFGFSIKDPLTKQYIKIAIWLYKYAHRSGAYNLPRDPADIINIWIEFEDILSKLIGNYYAISDRLDTLLKMEEPTSEILKTLPNILHLEARFIYFFKNLKSTNWLPHLYKEGYFNGASNPTPHEISDNLGYFTIPYWGVLQYLEHVAESNAKAPTTEASELLLSITSGISNYKSENGKRIENFRTDNSLFKIICNLPEQYLREEHFIFILEALKNKWANGIGYSYGKLLERLLNDEEKFFIKNGIEILLSHKDYKSNSFENIESIFENYNLSEIISEFKVRLIGACGTELLQQGIKKIEEVISVDEPSFNNYFLPAIENHEQTSFPDAFGCQLTYLVRDCLESMPLDKIADTIAILLKHEHAIFKRLAFHTIRIRYNELSKMFWGYLGNPLNQVGTKHEVFKLIKRHAKTFSNDQLKQILTWVESANYYISDNLKGQTERIEKNIAYQKKEWLAALSGVNSEELSNLTKTLNEINDSEIEHPGFDTWHTSLSGNVSPLTNEEILSMSLVEIIQYFDKFKEQEHNFMAPSIDGLSNAITLAIRKNPNLYNTECDIVINSSHNFMHTWISGLTESWKEEKVHFPTDEILETISKIVNKNEFWQSHNSQDKYGRWFISNLLSFFHSGLSDDNHAFDEKYLLTIKSIIIHILKMDKTEIDNHNDLSMTVLNTSRGHLYMVMIEYSLRLARVENKTNKRWDPEIKVIIGNLLNSKDENTLLYYVLGQYLPDINYLDEDWLFENFNTIFPVRNKTNLLSSLTGYLFYNSQLNKTHFDLFRKNGQYKIALTNAEELSKNTKNGLVEQICQAYLYGFEGAELENELLKTLISHENEDMYSYLIYFFWSPNRRFDTKIVHKIVPIWQAIFDNAILLKRPKIDCLMLSGSSKWINSVTKIDEGVRNILIKSAPYISQRDRYALLDGIYKHINNDPQKAGEILFELFKIEVTHDISRGKITDMIEILYQQGITKNIADKICLIHAEKEIDFLESIYRKYNT
ncbi:MAG: hypothetical protein ABI315_13580 [Bacteroidia bacterium]